MNITFKKWIKLWETLDPNVKNILLQAKWPANKEEVEKAIQELEADPVAHDKKSAFSILQSKFIKKKEIEIEEPKLPVLRVLYDNLKKKQITIPEYKTAVYFAEKENNSVLFQQAIDEMMVLLRSFISNNQIELLFKDKPEIRFEDQIISNYNDMNQFISILHGIQHQPNDDGDFKTEKGLQNPAFLELQNNADLVSKGKNIWVFKGDDPFKCRIMGKGQRWCISSSESVKYYFNYRHEYGQTQYFIFDFNKSSNDPARYVNPGVANAGEYSEWVDRRNARGATKDNISFSVNGYQNLPEYLDYLKSMGVNVSEFKAEPLSKFETSVKNQIEQQNLNAVKKDCEQEKDLIDGICKRMYYFLKLTDNLADNKFDELSDAEKAIFIIGKKINSKSKALFLSKNEKYLKDYLTHLSYSDIGWNYDNFIENFIISMGEHNKKEEIWNMIKNIKRKVNLSDIIQFIKRSRTPEDMNQRFEIIGDELFDKLKNDPDVFKNLGSTYLNDKIINMVIHGGVLINKLYEKLDPETFKKLGIIQNIHAFQEELDTWIKDPKKLKVLTEQRGPVLIKILEALNLLQENGNDPDVYLKFIQAIINSDNLNSDKNQIADSIEKLSNSDITFMLIHAPNKNLNELTKIIGAEKFEKFDEWEVSKLLSIKNRYEFQIWFMTNFAKYYPDINFTRFFIYSEAEKRKELTDALVKNKILNSSEVRSLLQTYRFYLNNSTSEKYLDKYIGWESMNNITDEDLVMQLTGRHWNEISAISPEWWATKDEYVINELIAKFLKQMEIEAEKSGDQTDISTNLKKVFNALGSNTVAKIDPAKVQELAPDINWVGATVKRVKNDLKFE